MQHNESVIVREALPSDAGQACAVADRAAVTLRDVYRPTPDLVRLNETRGAERCQLVAQLGGEIVGTISHQNRGDRLHLQSLAVEPNHQRRGIARVLVAHCAELARALGASRLSLFTVVETGNVPIFERLGFHVVSTEPACGLEPVAAAAVTEAYMEMPTPRDNAPHAQGGAGK